MIIQLKNGIWRVEEVNGNHLNNTTTKPLNQNRVKTEFVPYELALRMKALDYNEPCMAYYNKSKKLHFDKYTTSHWSSTCLAPLYQQAFRWFRENHNLKGHIEAVEYLDGTPDTYHWSIFNKCNSGYDQLTYEEAELECLRKLIGIVKNK